MTIQEETDEYQFVQHAVAILDVPNSRPDLEPGGLWVRGKIRLTWGLRLVTEPPTLQVGRSSAGINGFAAFLPYELPGRLLVWRTALENRLNSTQTDMVNLDFRDLVTLAAILGWEIPPDQLEAP